MKQWVDKITSWQKSKLTKEQVDKRASWQKSNLTKQQVDKTSSWQNIKSTKHQIDKTSSWQNSKLTKLQVDKIASWQNDLAPHVTTWLQSKALNFSILSSAKKEICFFAIWESCKMQCCKTPFCAISLQRSKLECLSLLA